MVDYRTLITDVGKAKIALAIANTTTVPITEVAVGDANLVEYEPDGTETALKNEVYRGLVNNFIYDGGFPNQVTIESIIPSTNGDFWIYEVGIFDTDGDMIAISNYPPDYKPTVLNGAVVEAIIHNVVQVANVSVLELAIDPTSVYINRLTFDAEVQDLQDTIETIIDESRVEVYDEGVLIEPETAKMNFVGNGVYVELNAPNEVTINIDNAEFSMVREDFLGSEAILTGGKYRITTTNNLNLALRNYLFFRGGALMTPLMDYDPVDANTLDLYSETTADNHISTILFKNVSRPYQLYTIDYTNITNVTFTVPIPLYSGLGNALVFKGGVLLQPDVDYVQDDAYTIRLLQQPSYYNVVTIVVFGNFLGMENFKRESYYGSDTYVSGSKYRLDLANPFSTSEQILVFRGILLREGFDYDLVGTNQIDFYSETTPDNLIQVINFTQN